MKLLLAKIVLDGNITLADPRFNKFLHYMSLLNRVPRRGWVLKGLPSKIAETTAEHSIKVRKAFNIHTFGRLALDDVMRGAIMCDMHDLQDAIEIDITPHDNKKLLKNKFKLEERAIKTICEGIPCGNEIMDLFYELNEHKTEIARYVYDFDKLDTSPQSVVYINGFDRIIRYYNEHPDEFNVMRNECYEGVPSDKVFDAMLEKLHEFHPYNREKIQNPELLQIIDKIEAYKGEDVYHYFYNLLANPVSKAFAKMYIRKHQHEPVSDLKKFLYKQIHKQVERI